MASARSSATDSILHLAGLLPLVAQWNRVGQDDLFDVGVLMRSIAGPESTPWVAQA